MALLSLQDASYNPGGIALLENASITIEPGERVCLTGRNGAGKSTLLGMLEGTIQPDTGHVIRSGPPFGFMPQDIPTDWQGTVFYVVTGNMPGYTVQHEAEWERYGETMGVINSLGLDAQADFASLSGGGKRRVALARALLQEENLILDEPTNHLDIPTIAWLEDFLIRKARTLVFVSHDRAFSRKLASRVVELDRGHLYSYACPYDEYLIRREERLENEEKNNALFDKKLAQEETWIRQGIKARRTRNMGRVRALQQLRSERAARRERLGNVRLLAQEAEKSGKLVLEARGVSFRYPGASEPVFQNFSTVIQRGDRVGIIGANGAGKSTLLKVMLGKLAPSSGTVRLGTNLEISYFDQLRETLDPEKSVMHSVADGNDQVIVGGQTRHVAGYLQDFLFTPDKLRLPVKALSGGERNRLLLARLFTRPSNLLVLDEPTNDLDVETLELLEELIADYGGTVLLVSHDRSFLDNLATSVLALEGDGLVHEYVGAYTDWLRQRSEPNKKVNEEGSRQVLPVREGCPKQRKLSYNEQRELEALNKELAALPINLEALELEQAKLETALADGEYFSRDPKGFEVSVDRLASVQAEQTALLTRWETIEARIADLDTERSDK